MQHEPRAFGSTHATCSLHRKPRCTASGQGRPLAAFVFKRLNPAFLPRSSFDLPCVATETPYACACQPSVECSHLIDDRPAMMAMTSIVHTRQCTLFRAGGGRVSCPARVGLRTYAQAATATVTAPAATSKRDRSHATDVVVIGSGIGGLSCASMLSSAYGRDVTVLESHSIPGGEA